MRVPYLLATVPLMFVSLFAIIKTDRGEPASLALTPLACEWLHTAGGTVQTVGQGCRAQGLVRSLGIASGRVELRQAPDRRFELASAQVVGQVEDPTAAQPWTREDVLPYGVAIGAMILAVISLVVGMGADAPSGKGN